MGLPGHRILPAILCLTLIATAAWGQTAAPKPGPKGNPKHSSATEDELARRLAAARAAQDTGDAGSVARANEGVIGLALRQLARLRLVQSAWPQAIALYQRSLDFEESGETRTDLALAYFGANRLDEALSQSEIALRKNPSDGRALTVRGRILMAKQDYPAAATALARAVQTLPDVETYYSLGISQLATKDAEQQAGAAGTFKEMARLAGDSGSVHVLVGRAYRDAGDMPGAIREFRRAVALDTKTPHAHYFLGLAQLAVNEWKPTPQIRAEFVKELEAHPKDYLANYLLGFLASSDRAYDESDRYLKAAAEIGPQWPEPWLYLGLNAYAQENMKEAEAHLRKAIELTGTDDSRSNYQIRRAYVDLGRILNNSSRAEEGEKYLAKARELQKKTMELTQQHIASVMAEGGGMMAAVAPLNPVQEHQAAPLALDADPFARVDAATLEHANLSAQQNAAIDSAEKRLRAILGLSFNDLATSEAVSGIYLAAVGHYQEAEKWDAAIPGLYRNLGMAAFRAQNFPEAIRGLSKALEESRDDASIRAMLGSAYFASDDYANAAKTIAPLGSRAMRDPVVGYAWAASLSRLGEWKEGTRVLEEVEGNSLPAETLLLVAKLWTDMGDYARAVNAAEKALRLDPAAPRAHYYAGVAYVQWQRQNDAIREFLDQLKLTPDDVETKNNLGYVYLEQAKQAEAEQIFRSALSTHPENGMAQYQLGKLLLDQEKVQEAVTHLEAAVRLLPDADYVHYQLQAAYRKESRIEEADQELARYKELKARNRQASIPRPMTKNP